MYVVSIGTSNGGAAGGPEASDDSPDIDSIVIYKDEKKQVCLTPSFYFDFTGFIGIKHVSLCPVTATCSIRPQAG